MLGKVTRRTLMAATLAVATSIAGLTTGTPYAAAQQQGGNLVYATGTDAQTLDPQFVTDVPTSRVVMHIHETLVYPDDQGEMQGVLAESWEISEDGKIWTFKLREGVTFHDGTPFNAEAVKYTFDRIMDDATGSPRKSATNSIESVTVIDDMTVEFVTKTPFAPFLAQLSAYNLAILSPTAAKEAGEDYSQNPVGTGPFKFASWSPGESVTLERYDEYWGEPAKLDTLEIRVVPEDSARVLMLLSGEAHVVSNVPPVMVERLEASPEVEVIQKTGFRTIYVGINTNMEPFDDPKVRMALAHAINKEALIQGVMQGLATAGGGFESPVIPGATEIDPYPYDPEKAKQLLAEAGYPDGFQSEFFVPTGRYVNDRQLGEAIQAQLAKVGIDVELKSPDWGTYTAMLREKQVPLYLIGKGSPTGDLDFTLTLTMGSEGAMNYSGYDSEEVDELLLEQRGIIDEAKREDVLGEILTNIYEDVPAIVLFYEDQLFGKRANVHDVEVLSNEFIDFSQAWIEQ